MAEPSAYDKYFFPQARSFIEGELARALELLAPGSRVLDIGDQGKVFPRPFPEGCSVKTLDLSPDHEPDYVGDICQTNAATIDRAVFDAVLLIEVLEHVYQPFDAVAEVERIVRPGGLVFFSSPLNCRIHGPIPDCWRFTEFGLQVLFKNFDRKVFKVFESPDRTLFPLQYFGVWQKPEVPREVSYQDLAFQRI